MRAAQARNCVEKVFHTLPLFCPVISATEMPHRQRAMLIVHMKEFCYRLGRMMLARCMTMPLKGEAP